MTAANKRLMKLLQKKYGRKKGTVVGDSRNMKKQLMQGAKVSTYTKDGGYIAKKRKKVVKKRKK